LGSQPSGWLRSQVTEQLTEQLTGKGFDVTLGGSSIDWQARVWGDPKIYWDIWEEGTRATKMALDEAGIGIPYPQMDGHVDGKLG
jgi:hypothetical protein